ncbi:MAG: FGGY-family carbohydrate kinase [Cyanobacteria bacterium P01_E01_bin.48]
MYLGIDFGTTGARAIAIRSAEYPEVVADSRFAFSVVPESHLTEMWRSALFELLDRLSNDIREQLQAIAINGTSGTVLKCDRSGRPLTPPLLYNDKRAAGLVAELKDIAPARSLVLSASSTLTKVLWLTRNEDRLSDRLCLHQADWLASLLHGRPGVTDYHNCLKLGYDVTELRYPDWLQEMAIAPVLPDVVAPGSDLGCVTPNIARKFGLPANCMVRAGTTDSIAAFWASGANEVGDGVTSLGSTLAIKLLSADRVEDARYGIYSHRFGDRWLAGGASNTGGAVLKQFFSDAELRQLSTEIEGDRPSPLDYYPLTQPGERFPINDPNLPPRLSPRPERDIDFLHGLLESMARIEAQGYELLQQLGASPIRRVYSAGGGAVNETWTRIRSRHLGVPLVLPQHVEAAYGTALLAAREAFGGAIPLNPTTII